MAVALERETLFIFQPALIWSLTSINWTWTSMDMGNPCPLWGGNMWYEWEPRRAAAVVESLLDGQLDIYERFNKDGSYRCIRRTNFKLLQGWNIYVHRDRTTSINITTCLIPRSWMYIVYEFLEKKKRKKKLFIHVQIPNTSAVFSALLFKCTQCFLSLSLSHRCPIAALPPGKT